MPELSSNLANTIREKLINIKLLIIDEISVVGNTLLNRCVDARLRQIMGINESFGGVSVILVGDLNQLPPAMDSLIFKISKQNEINALFDANLIWEEYKVFEFTKIMRQKDKTKFIEALNNLARNKLTEDDMNLFKSRIITDDSRIPNSVIRLFPENINVDCFNQNEISNHPVLNISPETKLN